MRHKALSPGQEALLAAEYQAGANSKELAGKHGVAPPTILNALRRQGVPIRTAQETRRTRSRSRFGPQEHEKALAMYRDGESVKSVARAFSVRTTAITALLKERQEPLHPGGRDHPRFRSDEQCQEVAAMYREVPDLRKIAEHYGCSVTPVQKALRRAGVTPRPGRPLFWTDARLATLASLHGAGRSQAYIAKEFGVSQSTIGVRLREMGLIDPSPRPRGAANPCWRGGRHVSTYGYVLVDPTEDDLQYLPARRTRYVQEHRLVMARSLGRPLRRTESVHHIDGDRSNNALENLQLRQGQHGAGVVMTCNQCGSHDIAAQEIATA